MCNFTPVIRENFRVGVPNKGKWKEVFNSDALKYGGSGVHNQKNIKAQDKAWHGQIASLSVTLPPLAPTGLLRRPCLHTWMGVMKTRSNDFVHGWAMISGVNGLSMRKAYFWRYLLELHSSSYRHAKLRS